MSFHTDSSDRSVSDAYAEIDTPSGDSTANSLGDLGHDAHPFEPLYILPSGVVPVIVPVGDFVDGRRSGGGRHTTREGIYESKSHTHS